MLECVAKCDKKKQEHTGNPFTKVIVLNHLRNLKSSDNLLNYGK